MNRKVVFTILLFLMHHLAGAQDSYLDNWPQWRGPLSTGASPTGNPPLNWSEEQNIKWKVEIPGKGHATPVIWGDRIFILTSIATSVRETGFWDKISQYFSDQDEDIVMADRVHQFAIICIHRVSGEFLWQTIVKEEIPKDGIHKSGTWASHSPVTDGEFIYAYFGSRGLYCLDYDGNLIWQKNPGPLQKAEEMGEGSSPVLHENYLYVLRDHEGDSFLYALDKQTGNEVWKSARDENTAWSTPCIVDAKSGTQIVTSAGKSVRGYDAQTGDLVWEYEWSTRYPIATPVAGKTLVYAMNGYQGSVLLAIDFNKAKGRINSSEAITWHYKRNMPYTPSPLLYENKLYFLKGSKGSISCLDRLNGKVYYTGRKLEGLKDVFASPVAAQNRIYITGLNGTTYVIEHGEQFNILAVNRLDDQIAASPVINANCIYLRGKKYLYCVGE